MSAAKWEAVGHLVRTEFAHGDEDKRGELVAEVAPGYADKTGLIAAAPELLEVLKLAEKEVGCRMSNTLIRRVYAVMDKATGSASS